MNTSALTKFSVSFALVVLTVSLSGGNGSGPAQSQPEARLPAADHSTGDAALAAPSSLPPATEPAPAELTQSASTSESCLRALRAVQEAGLRLPPETSFRCPGNTETTPGDRQHSGVACFDHAWYCPQGSYIAVNPAHVHGGDSGMKYVIAHEICHIDSYRTSGTPGTEEAADACAAAAGFPG